MANYHDETWLREKYHGEGLTAAEVAEIAGVTGSTIRHWMDNHGIERRPRGVPPEDKPYTDADWLRTEYVEKERSTREIAKDCDTTKTTINRWVRKHELGLRKRYEHNLKHPPKLLTDFNGYERIQCDGYQIRHHRLLAVAEYGFESVKDKHVHHKINVPWANWRENVYPIDASDHHSIHNRKLKPGEYREMVDRFLNTDVSAYDLAAEYGISHTAVRDNAYGYVNADASWRKDKSAADQ